MGKKMVIGIGGLSRSGKTKLAIDLNKEFDHTTSAIIHQDEYIHSAFQMPWIRSELDWEDPESLDFHRMFYEFKWLEKNVEVLIVEGLFAFYYPELNHYYDKRILVEIGYDEFVKRKKEDTRWGSVPDWYILHIWDSYHKFGIPDRSDDIIRVDGNQDINIKQLLLS